MREKQPYKIVAAYDTETTNIATATEKVAFPILHQLGWFSGNRLSEVTPENVREYVSVSIYRHAVDVFDAFENVLQSEHDYVPVVMVHNLGFDMFSLAPFLCEHDCTVLARTSTKPINITVLRDDGEPGLVLWDTLGMFAKSLETMGAECGMPKLIGAWDYERVRTPETPLTVDELAYATEDIYTLFAYIGYYLRLNPLIKEKQLARKVSTKTGAVRAKREELFYKLKGIGSEKQVGRMWSRHTLLEQPKTDDELYTMQACTRGGFTFTANRSAAIPFDLSETDMIVAGYDASSQHPAQMTAHLFPENFRQATPEILGVDMELVKRVTMDAAIENWAKPFPVAFEACIRFENMRLKAGSLWEHEGIATLASARGSKGGKGDAWSGSFETFGKLNSAENAELYVTELEWWLINQVYDYDSATPLSGYETGRFTRPTDFSVLAVMHFFKAKNTFKRFMKTRAADNEVRAVTPDYLVEQMEAGTADETEVKSYYQILKSDLNALYGIEITNEARAPQELQEGAGIVTLEGSGIADIPKQPKTWYQYGQRVVGWSRIAQAVTMELVKPHVKRIINGDTDSIKVLARRDALPSIRQSLDVYGRAVERARKMVCHRVKTQHPEFYDSLDGMGGYELEFTATRYCAAWNKAYMLERGNGIEVTLAGVPTERGDTSYTWLANKLMSEGWGWDAVCSVLLGYNVTVGYGLTRLNGRAVPAFGEWVETRVTDYLGNVADVAEPACVCLYRESKVLGGTDNETNRRNKNVAVRNNPDVNVAPLLLDCYNGHLIMERIDDGL